MDTKIFQYLEEKWYSPIGLVAVVLFSIISSAAVVSQFYKSTVAFIICVVVVPVIFALVWCITTSPKKTPKGKVGIIVSLYYDDKRTQVTAKQDFVIELKRLLCAGRLGESFFFQELPQAVAYKIQTEDDARVLRKKTRSHFIIHGKILNRKIKGKDHYVLNVNFLVGHAPISDDIREQFSKEMTELIPQKYYVNADDSLLEFEATTILINCASRYIIGMAAALSSDFDYAEKLFIDARSQLDSITIEPIKNRLTALIPLRLSEIEYCRAKLAYLQWCLTRDGLYLLELEKRITNIDEPVLSSLRVMTLYAVYQFLVLNDPVAAEKTLLLNKKISNPIWHLNLAFLKAYQGKLRDAWREYKSVEKTDIQADALNEVEDFIAYIIDTEPKKYQLHYLLGIFYMKLKGDNVLAEEELSKFVSLSTPNEYPKEMELSAKWIQELRKINSDLDT